MADGENISLLFTHLLGETIFFCRIYVELLPYWFTEHAADKVREHAEFLSVKRISLNLSNSGLVVRISSTYEGRRHLSSAKSTVPTSFPLLPLPFPGSSFTMHTRNIQIDRS